MQGLERLMSLEQSAGRSARGEGETAETLQLLHRPKRKGNQPRRELFSLLHGGGKGLGKKEETLHKNDARAA